MIEYVDGDLFHSPATVLVNPVNTQGVMGKGLALAFKNTYPRMFEDYQKACGAGAFSIGQLMLFREADYSILLFPTKKSWRQPSRLEYIEAGLEKFVRVYESLGISSIAFPKLGCGYGDLDWAEVQPLMERYLSSLPISIYVYVAGGFVALPKVVTKGKAKKRVDKVERDMSFAGLLSEIQGALSFSLVAYELPLQDTRWQLSWRDDGLLMTRGEEVFQLSEREIFQLWDDIRKDGVFAEGEKISKKIFYAFLERLGYLDRIGLMQQGKMIPGYQLYAGAGRMFLYKEMD